MAHGILVSWPGIEPVPPALAARNLNHWTAREAPMKTLILHQHLLIYRFSEIPINSLVGSVCVCVCVCVCVYVLVGIQNGAAQMEDSMEAPHKTKNRTTLPSSSPASGYRLKIIGVRISKRYSYFYIHWWVIYNSKAIETTYVIISE